MAITRVRWKRGTAADWTSANPVLRLAEPGWETDTSKFKVGDGVTAWADLDYVATGGGGGGGGDVAADTHAATSKTSLADADELPLIDSAGSFGLKKMLGSTFKTVVNGQLGAAIVAATTKATPVDADSLGYSDSAASGVGKKFTWANLKSALKGQISLDQWTAAAADVNFNSHKGINVTTGTANTDIANVGQLTSGLGSKLDTDDVQDAVLTAFNGLAQFVVYDTATTSWPTLDPTLAADSRAGWIFLFSDEGDPPPGAPSVAGPRLWARLVT